MKKFLAGLLFALLAPVSAFAQASGGAPISPTPGFGPSQLMNIVLGQTPLAGAWTASNCLTVSASGPPYYVAQATCGAGGGITGPGTTVVGNIAAWNSTSGSALLDTGISASSNTITGAISSGFSVVSGVGQQLYVGGNGAVSFRFTTSGSFVPLTTNTGNIGVAGAAWFTAAAVQTLNLEGSSTGFDMIQSGNTGTGNWTYKTPPATGTGTDTLVTLGATQTFSGANTFSGAVTHSGANTFSGTTLFSGSAPTMTANTTSIIGGSTSPTYPASTGGVMTFGGLLSAAPTLNSTGSGAVYSTTTGGLAFSGYGSSNDYTFYSHTGSNLGSIASSGLWSLNSIRTGSITNSTSTHLWINGTAPTVTSGFGTVQGTIGTANGTLRFDVNTNVGITGATGVVGLTAATTDWMCKAQSKNNATTLQVIQTGYATTSATFAPYTLAGVSSAWIASDVIAISCVAN